MSQLIKWKQARPCFFSATSLYILLCIFTLYTGVLMSLQILLSAHKFVNAKKNLNNKDNRSNQVEAS